MNMYKLIFALGNMRSRQKMKQIFGKEKTEMFYKKAKNIFPLVIEKTPDIGKSIFSFNYAFTPAYIAWFKATKELDFSEEDIKRLLWLMNEKIITTIPPFMRKAYGEKYLKDFRNNALIHKKRTEEGKIHSYDYLIEYKPQDNTHFGIDITRCGMKTLATDFDALGIFPTVCKVDYMIGAYLHFGFERTKTIGEGDECCDCRYIIGGKCEWNE